MEVEQASKTQGESVEDHPFEKAGFIDNLTCEVFVNRNPLRDIHNVTFTFPKETKPIMREYIKRNGKDPLVKMILSEVEKCQTAERK